MDKLGLYNGALRLLGERSVTLTENREPRRLLDDVWADNAHDAWLEVANWKFATKFVKIQYDPGQDIEFGYARSFTVPTDHVATSGVWVDEYKQSPLREYEEEGGVFYSDQDEIYVAYVSRDKGSDINIWPNSFSRFVQAFMAVELAPRLKNDKDVGSLYGILEMRRLEACNKDAKKSPSRKPSKGTWVSSRGGRNNYRLGYPT